MNSIRLTWLLVLLNLVILFIFFNVYVEKSGPGKYDVVTSKVNQDMSTVPVLASRVVGDVSGISERPLFNEDRQPVEIPEPAIPTKQTPTSNAIEYKLVGIVLLPENSHALLQTKSRELEWVLKGEDIDGWELTSVEPDSVVLVKAGKKVQLMLERTSQAVTKKRFKPNLKRSRR